MKKILLAIDDDLLREVYSRKLRKSKFKTFSVQTRKDIFTILNKEKIDLILLDVAIDNISGFEILEEIVKKDKDLPIFAFSTIGERELKENAIEKGAKEFVVGTEISPNELISKIKSFLK